MRTMLVLIPALVLGVLQVSGFQNGQTKAAPNRNRAAAKQPPVERLEKMSPEERERFLASLPPQRRAMLERRLNAYQHLKPEEKQRLTERYELFSGLSPAEQQNVRRSYRSLQTLPPERRRAVRRELIELRNLSPAERQKRLDEVAGSQTFSDSERDILKHLSNVMPNEPPPRPSPQ